MSFEDDGFCDSARSLSGEGCSQRRKSSYLSQTSLQTFDHYLSFISLQNKIYNNNNDNNNNNNTNNYKFNNINNNKNNINNNNKNLNKNNNNTNNNNDNINNNSNTFRDGMFDYQMLVAGMDSSSFVWNETTFRPTITLPPPTGVSHTTNNHLTTHLIHLGTSFRNIIHKCSAHPDISGEPSDKITQSFVKCSQVYMEELQLYMLSVYMRNFTSLLDLSLALRTYSKLIRYLENIFLNYITTDDNDNHKAMCLLTYLHSMTSEFDDDLDVLTYYLFVAAFKPLARQVQRWIQEGFDDDLSNNHTLFRLDARYTHSLDERFWKHCYHANHHDNLPSFLSNLLPAILDCAKSVCLLRKCVNMDIPSKRVDRDGRLEVDCIDLKVKDLMMNNDDDKNDNDDDKDDKCNNSGNDKNDNGNGDDGKDDNCNNSGNDKDDNGNGDNDKDDNGDGDNDDDIDSKDILVKDGVVGSTDKEEETDKLLNLKFRTSFIRGIFDEDIDNNKMKKNKINNNNNKHKNKDDKIHNIEENGNIDNLKPTTHTNKTPILTSTEAYTDIDTYIHAHLHTPLSRQSGILNRTLAKLFFQQCSLMSHFEVIKDFILLQNFNFASSIITQMCGSGSENGGSGDGCAYGGSFNHSSGSYYSVRAVTSPIFLNHILQQALISITPLHATQLSSSLDLLSFTLNHPSSHHNTNKHHHKGNLTNKSSHHHDTNLPYTPSSFFDNLDLSLKVKWPVNVIIQQSHLTAYTTLFTLALKVKRSWWCLKDVYAILSRCSKESRTRGDDRNGCLRDGGKNNNDNNSNNKDNSNNDNVNNNNNKNSNYSAQLQRLFLHRHKMHHFGHVISDFLDNQVVLLSWKPFVEKLRGLEEKWVWSKKRGGGGDAKKDGGEDNKKDDGDDYRNEGDDDDDEYVEPSTHTCIINELIHLHSSFLQSCTDRCLLNASTTPIRTLILGLLDIIILFRDQVVAAVATDGSGSGGCDISADAYDKLEQVCKKFSEGYAVLSRFVSNAKRNSMSPFLSDLIL